jgi:malate dehydrogenase
MERKDILKPTARSSCRREALNEVASRDVKVLVVGNPAGTNCLIAMKTRASLKPQQFTAMMGSTTTALTQVARKPASP